MLNINSYRRPPNWKKAKAPASHDSDVERCQEEPAQKKIAQRRTEVEADALGLCFLENH